MQNGKLSKIDLQTDLESLRLLLQNEDYRGYCEYLSPVSPIYNSTFLSLHYKFVHSFSKYRIVLHKYLAVQSMEKASGGTEVSDGFKKNPPVRLELLHSHYHLKKLILDDLIGNIPKLPVSNFIIKWSIHKTLLRQYLTPISWLFAFIGVF